MSDENPDVKEARRLQASIDSAEAFSNTKYWMSSDLYLWLVHKGGLKRLLVYLGEVEKKLDRWTRMRRSGTPSFDGEGKYDDQWSAWDDGYVQGLDVFLTRAEAAESSLTSLREENARLREALTNALAIYDGAIGDPDEPTWDMQKVIRAALAGPVTEEKIDDRGDDDLVQPWEDRDRE